MDFNNILAFVAVATLLVVSPGPNGFLITKTVPLFGKKAGLLNVFGFVAAFYVHATLAIFGISLILVKSSQAFFIFKMLGAAYLIWIGVKALISAFSGRNNTALQSQPADNKRMSSRSAFFEGFLTNVLNPKVSMFYLAAFPQFISVNDSALNAYALVTAHSVVNFLWFSAMIVMISRVKSVTSSGRFKVWLNSITGLVFIGFGTKLALMKSSQ